MRIAVFLVAGMLAAAGPAAAGETLPGPVAATVVRVVDGDTLEVRARVWLGLEVTARVRLRGIDTPEARSRCADERALAAAATARLAALGGTSVVLTNVAADKYGGRVLADVAAGDGTDLAAAMVAGGLARPYAGGARAPWCALAATGG
jgi:endonuclease YncB( thermonuclease family)